jgi:sugar O-acyltransferase (sialic acid O-acetyltransferase NeuD family)
MSERLGRPVVIFGADKLAKVAQVSLDYHSNEKYRVAAFTLTEDYLRRLSNPEFRGKPVVAFEDLIRTYPPDGFSLLIAVGPSKLNHTRAAIYAQCKELGYDMVRYVHPDAYVGDEVELGDNTFILQGNNVDPFVTIGNNVFVWAQSHIGHESVVGDHVFITTGVTISGSCRIGDYSYFGVNSCVADGVTVGKETFVGMGVPITRDTEDRSVYKPNKVAPQSYTTEDMILGLR